MLPNEYHMFVANQILDCDIERLDAAVREVTGHGLISYIKANLPKKPGGNLKFKRFNLVRYAYKGNCLYIGKEPAHDGAEPKVFKIHAARTTRGGWAEVWRNDAVLFELTAKSLSRAENCEIAALHGYIGRSRRAHKKAKKGGAE